MSETNEGVRYRAPSDVSSQRLAKVYAEALLRNAQQQQLVDGVLESLESLVQDVFAAQPLLEEMFAAPVVATHVKEQAIHRTCEGRVSDLFRNFLLVLNHHGRLELLRLIAQEYHKLVDQLRNRVPVLVRVAAPLAEDQRQRLAEFIGGALRLEPVLDVKVDPDLLGGLVVRVADWQFDGSVRSRLVNLRNQLIERSSHEIQSGRDRFRSE
jgi:F-type H+-transporting ATPase subunit delta